MGHSLTAIDISKFNNLGQYISVDNRPLSAGRGFAQDITKLFRRYLRSAASRDGLSPPINDPFLCVHVLCLGGAYDVNIEPSKDDVLFEEQQAVLSLVEDLLRDTYGDLSDVHEDHGSTGQGRGTSQRNGFEVLLSKKQQSAALSTPALASSPQERSSVGSRLFARPEPCCSPPEPHSCGEQANRSLSFQLNNLRATMGTASPGVDAQDQRRLSLHAEIHLPGININPREAGQGDDVRPCLPSPISSPDSPAAAVDTTPSSSLGPSQLLPTTSARDMRQQQRQIDRERYGNGSLDTWFLKLSQSSQSPAATGEPETRIEDPPLSQLTQDYFGTERARPNGTSDLANNPSQTTSEISLQDSLADSGSTEGSPRTLARPAKFVNKPGLPVLEQWSARLYSAANPEENPELQKALEFETRKKAAIQERRMQLQNPKPTTSKNSPHQSRYLAARAALSSQPKPSSVTQQSRSGSGEIPTNGTGVSKTVFSPQDPRAYLIQLQNSDVPDGPKLKRIASAKMPFEKIPEEHDLHSVGLTLPAGLPLIYSSFKKLWNNDLYTQSGEQVEGFVSPDIKTVIESWDAHLSSLIRAHYRLAENSDIPNLQFDFSELSRVSQGSG